MKNHTGRPEGRPVRSCFCCAQRRSQAAGLGPRWQPLMMRWQVSHSVLFSQFPLGI